MANNIPQLKVDIKTAFGADLDATTIQKVRDRFVASYQTEWNQRVATGTVDNAANRNTFAVDKVFDYINAIYTSRSVAESVATLPPGEIIS